MTRLAAVAAALVLALAGCGLSGEGHVQTATDDQVPYGLLHEDTTTTSTTLPELRRAEAAVWFVSGDHLVELAREVATPVSVDRVVEVLAEGTTENEGRLGVRTALPDGVVTSAGVEGDTAVVGLDGDFTAATSPEQLLSLGQLVFTITAVDRIESVVFELDGAPIAVPRADGSVAEGPVGRADYASLLVAPA